MIPSSLRRSTTREPYASESSLIVRFVVMIVRFPLEYRSLIRSNTARVSNGVGVFSIPRSSRIRISAPRSFLSAASSEAYPLVILVISWTVANAADFSAQRIDSRTITVASAVFPIPATQVSDRFLPDFTSFMSCSAEIRFVGWFVKSEARMSV